MLLAPISYQYFADYYSIFFGFQSTDLNNNETVPIALFRNKRSLFRSSGQGISLGGPKFNDDSPLPEFYFYGFICFNCFISCAWNLDGEKKFDCRYFMKKQNAEINCRRDKMYLAGRIVEERLTLALPFTAKSFTKLPLIPQSVCLAPSICSARIASKPVRYKLQCEAGTRPWPESFCDRHILIFISFF